MSSFDPYHKWLGIRPEEQPATHYRLLGLHAFESDVEVISAAADQRMAFVQQCATGEYLSQSQEVLNALSKARTCLLNPRAKADYDQRLRSTAESPPLKRSKAESSVESVKTSASRRPNSVIIAPPKDDEDLPRVRYEDVAPPTPPIRKKPKKVASSQQHAFHDGPRPDVNLKQDPSREAATSRWRRTFRYMVVSAAGLFSVLMLVLLVIDLGGRNQPPSAEKTLSQSDPSYRSPGSPRPIPTPKTPFIPPPTRTIPAAPKIAQSRVVPPRKLAPLQAVSVLEGDSVDVNLNDVKLADGSGLTNDLAVSPPPVLPPFVTYLDGERRLRIHPSEEHGGQSQKVTLTLVAGVRALDRQVLTITVIEANNRPTIVAPADGSEIACDAGFDFALKIDARDTGDQPANSMRYMIDSPPETGLSIDGSGLLSWRSIPEGRHKLRIAVIDNGEPPASAEVGVELVATAVPVLEKPTGLEPASHFAAQDQFWNKPLSWKAVDHAKQYRVEYEQCRTKGTKDSRTLYWTLTTKKVVDSPSLSLIEEGMAPLFIRWRVIPLDRRGGDGPATSWRVFFHPGVAKNDFRQTSAEDLRLYESAIQHVDAPAQRNWTP